MNTGNLRAAALVSNLPAQHVKRRIELFYTFIHPHCGRPDSRPLYSGHILYINGTSGCVSEMENIKKKEEDMHASQAARTVLLGDNGNGHRRPSRARP